MHSKHFISSALQHVNSIRYLVIPRFGLAVLSAGAVFALWQGGTTIVLVAENDQKQVRRPGRIWHHVLVGLAVCAAFLIIFHRPILLAIGRQIVLRYATRENLKIDFRLEGNPFGHLTVRNLRAIPTGASGIESIDI